MPMPAVVFVSYVNYDACQILIQNVQYFILQYYFNYLACNGMGEKFF